MLKQVVGRLKTGAKTLTRANLDALDLLRSDHMKVEALLLQLRVSRSGETRMKILRQIQSELDKHMKVEEQILYPACEKVDRLKGLVEHSHDEHDEIREIIRELKEMDASSSRFSKRVTELIKSIEHHVMDEENKLFPKIRDAMDKSSFNRMNREMIEAHGLPKRAKKAA